MPSYGAPSYYASPYAAAIAEALGAPYRARAEAALRSGEATAHAWGQVGSGISSSLNDVMKVYQDAPRRALETARVTSEQQQIDAEKRKVADQQRVDTAMGAMAPGGPNDAGDTTPGLSRQGVLDSLPGHLRDVVQKRFDDMDERAAKVQKQRVDYLKSAADDMADLGYDVWTFKGEPTATALALDRARKTYAADPELLRHVENVAQQIAADPSPENVTRVAAGIAGHKYASVIQKADIKTREVTTVDPVTGKRIIKIVEDKPNQSFEAPPVEMTPAQQAAHDLGLRNANRADMTAASEKQYREWQMAGGKPVNLSPAARAVAQRNKDDDLNALEKEITKQASGFGDPLPPAEIVARKLRIENSYRTQLGLEPVERLPSAWDAQPGPAPQPAAIPPAGRGAPPPTSWSIPRWARWPQAAPTMPATPRLGSAVTVGAEPGSLEAQAQALVTQIRALEAQGQDASALRQQLAALRAKVKR